MKVGLGLVLQQHLGMTVGMRMRQQQQRGTKQQRQQQQQQQAVMMLMLYLMLMLMGSMGPMRWMVWRQVLLMRGALCLPVMCDTGEGSLWVGDGC
jgi:hypothetical protein